jgi:type I restriction enzyme S subunit
MMEEWKEYKLGDVASVQTGPFGSQLHNKDYVLRGTPIVTVEHLGEREFSTQNLPCVSEEDKERLRKYTLKEGDVVYSRVGSVDRCSYVSTKENGWLFSGRCLRVRSDISVCSLFLYYYLQQENVKQSIRNIAVGATMPSINTKLLSEIRVSIPSLNIQKRIASILSSLDDKIEVNRKINENLEQQAQALFKSWYVDFEPFKDGEFVESELGMIPKGWRVVSLDEMTSKFGTGLNPRKNFKLGEGNNYYVTIKNMGNNRVYLDDKCDKVTDDAIEKINKRSKLQEGDLLFSGIGTIGRVALVTQTPTNWNTSESVFNMHPTQNISSEFLYILLLSDVFQQYVKIHAQGGVQQGIRMASLKEYRMAIPEDSLLRKFDDIVMPIISRIKNNDNQSDSLASLRDTLLPKLMSGELKVNEIEK